MASCMASRCRACGRRARWLTESIKLSSIAITGSPGTVSGSGTYDLRSRHFQAEARGEGLDLARCRTLAHGGQRRFPANWDSRRPPPAPLRSRRWMAMPRWPDSRWTTSPWARWMLTAHTVNRDLVYDATSRMEAAEFVLHGQTNLARRFRDTGQARFLALQYWRGVPAGASRGHQGRIGALGHGHDPRPASASRRVAGRGPAADAWP